MSALLILLALLALVLINVPIAVALGLIAALAMVAKSGPGRPAERRGRDVRGRDQISR